MNKKQEVIVWMTSLYLLFVAVFFLVMCMNESVYYIKKFIPELIVYMLPAIVIGALLMMSFRNKKD